MKIISVCHANDTNIQMNDFPVDLIWKGGFLKLGNNLFYSYSLSAIVFNKSHAFAQVVNSLPPFPLLLRFLFSYTRLTISEES